MPVSYSRRHEYAVIPPHPALESMFSDAPVLPTGHRLIRHGIRETVMLRHVGIELKNPMELYYDWCGGTPYSVQVSTCRMMVENRRFFNLNHMGTGKTKTALWSWDYLNKKGITNKLLVVAPLSTLTTVWAAEVFATLQERKVAVLHGSRQKRLDKLKDQSVDIYVINHDGLKVIQNELHERTDIDCLVLDELAVYRNNSDRSKRMRKFAQRFAYVWGMTGAPMPTEPTDVWGQCMIIAPNRVPKFFSHARDMLMVNVGPYTWLPKSNAVDTAFGWMQPSCRYSLDEVVELPPVVYRTVEVELSSEQQETYKKVAVAMATMVKEKQITAANAGVAMSKLLQIAGGWVYTTRPEFVRLDPTPRVVAMADLIRSCTEKVLVAIPFRHMIDGISKILSMKGVDIEHTCVHGDTPRREEIFSAFQHSDKYKVLLVHPQCVAHGLTLTAASMIVWYLPCTSLEIYDQFNARITRIGQKHKQQVLHLQGSRVEQRVYKLLQDHQALQNQFLSLVEGATDGID